MTNSTLSSVFFIKHPASDSFPELLLVSKVQFGAGSQAICWYRPFCSDTHPAGKAQGLYVVQFNLHRCLPVCRGHGLIGIGPLRAQTFCPLPQLDRDWLVDSANCLWERTTVSYVTVNPLSSLSPYAVLGYVCPFCNVV